MSLSRRRGIWKMKKDEEEVEFEFEAQKELDQRFREAEGWDDLFPEYKEEKASKAREIARKILEKF